VTNKEERAFVVFSTSALAPALSSPGARGASMEGKYRFKTLQAITTTARRRAERRERFAFQRARAAAEK